MGHETCKVNWRGTFLWGVAVGAHENTLLLLFGRARTITRRVQMQRPFDWGDDPLLH
jgi:hypothetical protein